MSQIQIMAIEHIGNSTTVDYNRKKVGLLAVFMVLLVIVFAFAFADPDSVISYSNMFEYYDNDYLYNHSSKSERGVGTFVKILNMLYGLFDFLVLVVIYPFLVYITYLLIKLLLDKNQKMVIDAQGIRHPHRLIGSMLGGNVLWKDINEATLQLKQKRIARTILFEYKDTSAMLKAEKNIYYKIELYFSLQKNGAKSGLTATFLDCSIDELYAAIRRYYV